MYRTRAKLSCHCGRFFLGFWASLFLVFPFQDKRGSLPPEEIRIRRRNISPGTDGWWELEKNNMAIAEEHIESSLIAEVMPHEVRSRGRFPGSLPSPISLDDL